MSRCLCPALPPLLVFVAEGCLLAEPRLGSRGVVSAHQGNVSLFHWGVVMLRAFPAQSFEGQELKGLSLDRKLNTCSPEQSSRQEQLQTLGFPTPSGTAAGLPSFLLGDSLGAGTGPLTPKSENLRPLLPLDCSVCSQ